MSTSESTATSNKVGEHIFRRKDISPRRGGKVVVTWVCACDGKARETEGISESEARGFARLDWSDHVRKSRT